MSSSENKNRTCAIIPFFNERFTIDEVVKRTIPYVDHVFLIDDGSTDNYKISEYPPQNISLLRHEVNIGKGAALRTGFEHAFNKGYDPVITLDGDLQHEPEKIPLFIAALKNYDIVIGSRMNDTKSMPVQRILSNKITSAMVYIKTGKKVFDSQSGFRGYNSRFIRSFNGISNNWGAETEILIIAAKKGAQFGSVPVPTIYNDLNTSKMQPLRAIFQFLRAIFKSYSY
ncbi:MAG: dolichyl-phosphate mannose synthase [Melioribacteraceae bacterium]|nr:MAG: dolichyl-phosphate mannose synthase [Melioribacteraceae bacterium]